jgi:predicted ATPase
MQPKPDTLPGPSLPVDFGTPWGGVLTTMRTAPYLVRVGVVADRIPSERTFPFSLPFVAGLDLALRSPVTFFVGENGSGKSTLLEAIAALCRLPVSGGSRNDLGAAHGPERDSDLARALRPAFVRRPPDGYFLRAEFYAHFASLLDERFRDPDFRREGNPYDHYGGQSLHARSHGEAFLAIIQSRFHRGLFLLDEPESALSPQRQLTLLAQISELVEAGVSQFIIATHSPILMTFPGAHIVSFDEPHLPTISLEQTSHFQLTRDVLNAPAVFWRHLRGKGPT